MLAILKDGINIDNVTKQNNRFLDFIDLATGTITDPSQLRTFNGNNTITSTITNTIVANWEVYWSNYPLNSFGANSNTVVILKKESRIPGKNIFIKMTRNDDGYIRFKSARSYNQSTGVYNSEYEVDISMEMHINHTSYNIKIAPGVFVIKNNQDNTISIFSERTHNTEYDLTSLEVPVIYFSPNRLSRTVMAYKPSSNSYQLSGEIFDISVQWNWLNTVFQSSDRQYVHISMLSTRNSNNQPVLPIFPILFENLEYGWVGGDISEYSGLYFCGNADHTFQNNNTINFNGKNYRLMHVASYAYRPYHMLVADE